MHYTKESLQFYEIGHYNNQGGAEMNKTIELTSTEVALIAFALGALMPDLSEEGIERTVGILGKLNVE